jgi:aryl-alcohol dehydrogenase-like predicted oxidoreductase
MAAVRTLGQHGPSVSDIGLGCMGMSDLYGPADDAESLATIHAALDAGVTLLDTGDYYGMDQEQIERAIPAHGAAGEPLCSGADGDPR